VYKNILVPIDGSDTARLGLNEAIELAKSLGSRIRLIHVISDAALLSPYTAGIAFEHLLEGARDYGQSLLRDAQAVVRQANVEVDAKLAEASGGPAGEQIVLEASAWRADLIVCGTHGRRGLRRLVMGSDAEYIVRLSPVPVLLVRSK
jgi:nucleotide-binding universal stress UspA family protein